MRDSAALGRSATRESVSGAQWFGRHSADYWIRRTRRVVLALMVISLAGCTALQTIAGTPPDLQARIVAGELLTPGDRVLIVTSDGTRHQFKVTALRPNAVEGKHESVPVDQIVSVQKRRFSVARTVCLAVVGGAVLVWGIVAAAHAASHIAFLPNGPS